MAEENHPRKIIREQLIFTQCFHRQNFNHEKISLCVLYSLIFIACNSQSSISAPEQSNTEFFKLYQARGEGPALEFIFSTNKWISADDKNNVNTKLTELTAQLGKYYGYELITQKSIGKNFLLFSYMVKYERQPIRFTMTYYKPSDKWQVQIFEFDYDLHTELKEAASPYRLNENLPSGNEK